MMLFKKEIAKFPVGVWVAFAALFLISLAWLMQLYSLINWEGAIHLGVQDNSFTGNSAERALADVERGIAIADLVWALPLTLIAFVGLARKKIVGFVAAVMTFAICVYFPLIYIFRASTSTDIVLVVLILWATPSLIGIAGLWSDRKHFTM